MPEWIAQEGTMVTGTLTAEQELYAERQMNALMRESMADLENLYREDQGWNRLGAEEDTFSAEGRKRVNALCRISARTNPLLKRGVGLRIAYVWGSGVAVSINSDGDEGQQDVNEVVQTFWDDPGNLDTFTGSQAQEMLERGLATDGEVFLSLPTLPTGRVQVRRVLPEEVDAIICDPEDAARVWYYKRCWSFSRFDLATGQVNTEDRVTYYPALGFWPTSRPRRIGGQEVRWDAPMLHVRVNKPERSERGLGDVFAALPWARADKEVLEAWVMIYKALSRIAYKVSTKGDKAAQVAQKIARTTPSVTNPQGGAATVAMDPNTTLEAVPKTGAIIDADGARPLMVMVAAALGVPVTMLTGDPGSTGARAVAETLDQPTELEMSLRREVWTAAIQKIVDYVIDQAVIAPLGGLRGTMRLEDSRRLVDLPEGDERTIAVDWPEYDSVPVDTLMKALQMADSLEVLPPLVKFRLVCKYLQIEDADELIEELTDEDGNWIPLDVKDDEQRDAVAQRGGTPPPVGDEAPEEDQPA